MKDEIKKLDLKTGRAADTFPGGVKFDEAGRRVGAPVCIVQWQDGKPITVYPTDRAAAKGVAEVGVACFPFSPQSGEKAASRRSAAKTVSRMRGT